jgi:predicted extracellular nuclease
MKIFFASLLLAVVCVSCKTTPQLSTRTIGFYNVENLFDTIDGINDDAEFLPAAKKQWNSEKYNEKLNHVNQVIDQWNNPLLIGLCEIENAAVVRDVMRTSSKIQNYGLVHYESPDARGIDVALLYDSLTIKLNKSGRLRYTLPGKDEPSSRDILWAKFTINKDTIMAMVNHWPSRTGGVEKSEPNRIAAAQTARKFIDSLLTVNKNYKIVFMGDLNDHPSDKAPQLIAEKLSPMITEKSGEFGGTHSWNGKFDVLDHIFVSEGFMIAKKLKIVPNSGKIGSYDFLLGEYKGNIVPARTYAGDNYLGGYSDHFPVTVEVSIP